MLVGNDEGAIQDDFEEIGLHLRDDSINDAAQAVVGLLLIREGCAYAGDNSAAVVDELRKLYADAPSLSVDVSPPEADIVDLAACEAVVGI